MKYRKNIKNGDDISALGFGFMRVGKDDGLNERMLRYAILNGVNYIDTAYIYPNNEATLGRLLEQSGLRDKVNIATKLPPYMVRKLTDAERIFAASLERLRTGRIEYYLMHMISGISEWERLTGLGIQDWIKDKKQLGMIKNIGFSYHGGPDDFVRLIDAYDWDFCMIQYNYMDEHTQAGRRGLEYAAGKGIPVIIMEPLRGGTLANRMPAEAADVYSKWHVKRTPAEWSFRWLWDQPGVLTVLSGMKTIENIEENIRSAKESEPGMLTGEEMRVYAQIQDIMRKKTLVPCTACGYCMPCPKGVDIPMCFDLYNQRAGGGINKWFFYVLRTMNNNAGLCVECGKCEPACPQGIKIRQELRGVKRKMEGFIYKPARLIIKKVMKR